MREPSVIEPSSELAKLVWQTWLWLSGMAGGVRAWLKLAQRVSQSSWRRWAKREPVKLGAGRLAVLREPYVIELSDELTRLDVGRGRRVGWPCERSGEPVGLGLLRGAGWCWPWPSGWLATCVFD